MEVLALVRYIGPKPIVGPWYPCKPVALTCFQRECEPHTPLSRQRNVLEANSIIPFNLRDHRLLIVSLLIVLDFLGKLHTWM